MISDVMRHFEEQAEEALQKDRCQHQASLRRIKLLAYGFWGQYW